MIPTFDISDIVDYAQYISRVAGIPRVQMKMIAALMAQDPPIPARCFFRHPIDHQLYLVDASRIFDQPEFDSIRMLARVNAQRKGPLPHKQILRDYLRPYEHRKLKRAAKKLQVYWLAHTAPQRLANLGVRGPYHVQPEEALELTPITAPPAKEPLISLGSIWSFPELMPLYHRHKALGGEVIQMVHDLIPDKHPQWCLVNEDFQHFLTQSKQYTTHYLAVSENTRRDLRCHLEAHGVDIPVSVLRLAHEFEGFQRNETRTRPDKASLLDLAQSPYVLCVGTIEIRKNGANLIRVWDRLLRSLGPERTPRLVFAGRLGWKLDDFHAAIASAPGLSGHLQIIDAPSDQDLAFLYQQCLFTSYPSYYEGWGLPVGEAAWFGKICLASNQSSLPEVLGPLARYTDPHDLDDMFEQHHHLITHPDALRAAEAALREAPLRTWKDVGRDLQDILSTLQNTAPCLNAS